MLLDLVIRSTSGDPYAEESMHQRREQESPMEIEQLAFPRKDRLLGLLKGARGGIEPHPVGTCLDHLPDHAHRGFQPFQEGMFCLRETGRAGSTCVHDTATMILCGRGRIIFNISRVTSRALAL